MGGRRAPAPGKPTRGKARPAAAAAGRALLAALGLVVLVVLLGPRAGAAGTVTSVFSVTGVSTSNCPVSTGGADIYLRPGDTLQAKTSAVGLTSLGLPLDLSAIGGFAGKLVIDPTADSPEKYDLSTENATISGLDQGDHQFTWTATAVNLSGVPIKLGLDATVAKAGAALARSGTIHVTDKAADCSIAVRVPASSGYVSAGGLPPVEVSLPTIPGRPANGAGPAPATTSHSSDLSNSPGPTVPEQVVPSGDFAAAPPNAAPPNAALPNTAGTGDAAPTTPASSSRPIAAAPLPTETTAPIEATAVGLASRQSPSAQLPVVLAIVAVLALVTVTATYARQRLLP
jgi:hypothetical protein